ncbi:MAG: type VI secretion system tip protein TssI/VgrG, partial [Myxococcota bacterium]
VPEAEEFFVLEWQGREAINEPWALTLRLLGDAVRAEELGAKLLGQPAELAIANDAESGASIRRGYVRHVSLAGKAANDRAIVVVELVPRLALLDLRENSRVYQDRTIVEIIQSLFEEWGIECTPRLSREYRAHPYTTQYRETDLAFIRRIAGREGLSFFSCHPAKLRGQAPFEEDEEPPPEVVTLTDDPGFYLPVPDEAGFGGVAFRHSEEAEAATPLDLASFSMHRALAPEVVRLADFDFRRPGLALKARAALPDGMRTPVGEELGADKFSVFRHGQRGELSDGRLVEVDESVAYRRLAQLRIRAEVGHVRGRSAHIWPGIRFAVEGHRVAGYNDEFVAVEVLHEGQHPLLGGDEGAEHSYRTQIRCVPGSALAAAPDEVPRVHQALETAIVLGPDDGGIHTDEFGRVQVTFHWQDTGAENHCWLRVASPWSGTYWGGQFIPRAGTEVLVGFLAGDIDRPVVVGGLYNGVHPPPFRLPDQRALSGFRSKSLRGGASVSELVFDDTEGAERLVVKSGRDFHQEAEGNYRLFVRETETVEILGPSTQSFKGPTTRTFAEGYAATFLRDEEKLVKGRSRLAIDGDREVRVGGDHELRVDGRTRHMFGELVDETYEGDVIRRVLSNEVTVVGQAEAPRSAILHVEGTYSASSTRKLEVASDDTITLG